MPNRATALQPNNQLARHRRWSECPAGLETDFFGNEVPRLDQETVSVAQCRRPYRSGVNTRIGDGHGLIDVALPRAAVIPKPVSDVGVLLDLAQYDAPTDGVDCVRGGEVSLARLYREPVDELLDFARGAGFAEAFTRDGAPKTKGDGRSRLGLEYVVHLGFALSHTFAIIGVHLDRKPV